MYRFIIQRLLSTIPVLFGIVLITFVLTRSIPGDPCRSILGERATDQVCDAFMVRYGLNEPILTQFGIYLGDVLRGDLGNSFQRGRVTDLLIERMPITIELTLAALTFAVLVGVPLGMISAYRRNSVVDVSTMVGANVGVSMPVFWLGLMLAYLFAVVLKDTPFMLPPSGRLPPGYSVTPVLCAVGHGNRTNGQQLPDFPSHALTSSTVLLTWNWDLIGQSIRHLILPAITVGTIPLAIIARMTRSSMLEALNQDYVRTARSKGLNERKVVFGHALKNALLPVVTVIGLNFGFLIAGAVLTETIFSLTGIGRTLNDAITARDYSVIQGVTLTTAMAFVFINLAVDVLYGFLDPRIRLS